MKFLTITFVIVTQLFSQAIHQLPAPEWVKNVSIYEVNLRQFSETGSVNRFRNDLPRLKELGVGILWFMPIHPIGEKNRKGTLGSYYSVKDYTGFSPEYGSPEDFKQLIKEAHSLGMYVIIDWVANHTAWDNPWVTQHPEYYTKDEKGNFVPPVADWQDVVDLNFENKALRTSMTEALRYWVKEFNIDGFRCDVAGMVPQSFWQEAIREVNKSKTLFWLAEWEDPIVHDKAFHMSYGWNFHGTFAAIAQGKEKASKIISLLQHDAEKLPKGAFRMQFTTNHDENSWNGTEYEKFGEGALAFAALTYVLPGMPLIYNGQESANKKRLNFFEKDPIDWGSYQLSSFYKTLNALKKNNSALFSGSFGGSFSTPATGDENVLCLIRQNGKKSVVALFNLSSVKREVSVASSALSGKMKNVFSNETTIFKGVWQAELQPWEYIIFER